MPNAKLNAATAMSWLRETCLAMPEATERETWGQPTFRVREKIFAMRGGEGQSVNVWCKAKPGIQLLLVSGDPDHYFKPPYVGPKGWIGIRLEGNVDLDEAADLIGESYRLVAPKRLVAELDQNL